LEIKVPTVLEVTVFVYLEIQTKYTLKYTLNFKYNVYGGNVLIFKKVVTIILMHHFHDN